LTQRYAESCQLLIAKYLTALPRRRLYYIRANIAGLRARRLFARLRSAPLVRNGTASNTVRHTTGSGGYKRAILVRRSVRAFYARASVGLSGIGLLRAGDGIVSKLPAFPIAKSKLGGTRARCREPKANTVACRERIAFREAHRHRSCWTRQNRHDGEVSEVMVRWLFNQTNAESPNERPERYYHGRITSRRAGWSSCPRARVCPKRAGS
jgi:hypothetical protein